MNSSPVSRSLQWVLGTVFSCMIATTAHAYGDSSNLSIAMEAPYPAPLAFGGPTIISGYPSPFIVSKSARSAPYRAEQDIPSYYVEETTRKKFKQPAKHRPVRLLAEPYPD